MFKAYRLIKEDNLRLQNLLSSLREEVEGSGKERQAVLKACKDKIEQDLMDAHRRSEQQKDLELEKHKQYLETEYQKRVTEYQEKFFTEMKKLFIQEVGVLKESYQKLIESMI